MMSRWRLIHNREQTGSAKAPGTHNKGLARRLHEAKRDEAETRQEFVVHENSKAHRLGKCCRDQAEPVRKVPRHRRAA